MQNKDALLGDIVENTMNIRFEYDQADFTDDEAVKARARRYNQAITDALASGATQDEVNQAVRRGNNYADALRNR